MVAWSSFGNKEAKLKFLHQKGPSPSFTFPNSDDVLIVRHTDILMTANPTIPSGRAYKLSNAELEEASYLLGLKCYED